MFILRRSSFHKHTKYHILLSSTQSILNCKKNTIFLQTFPLKFWIVKAYNHVVREKVCEDLFEG